MLGMRRFEAPKLWIPRAVKRRLSANYPARGRKLNRRPLPTNLLDNYFQPITPQGDGNIGIRVEVRWRKAQHFFQPITPQGDGNFHGVSIEAIKNVFQPITPQGDGNSSQTNWRSPTEFLFQPITPQGDGNSGAATLCSLDVGSLSANYPARGRKPRPCSASSTTTLAQSFSQLPRKGTETVAARSILLT